MQGAYGFKSPRFITATCIRKTLRERGSSLDQLQHKENLSQLSIVRRDRKQKKARNYNNKSRLRVLTSKFRKLPAGAFVQLHFTKEPCKFSATRMQNKEHTEHHIVKAENLFTCFMMQETESNSVTKDVTSDIARKPEDRLKEPCSKFSAQ
jgi:hypothetical protein